MMSFDLIRRKSKRVDIFCCIKVDQDKVRPREPANHSHSNSNHHDLAKTNSQCGYPPPTYDEFVSTQSINGVACPIDKSGSNRYLTSVQRSSGLRSRCGLQHWTLHRFVKDYYVKWLCKTPVKVGFETFSHRLCVKASKNEKFLTGFHRLLSFGHFGLRHRWLHAGVSRLGADRCYTQRNGGVFVFGRSRRLF